MLHQLRSTQILNSTVPEVWDFIGNPKNLQIITPDYMRFQILSPSAPIYAGQLIEYYVRPILGVRLHWVTEITHVSEGHYFVDEQRFGPYAFWQHQHFILPGANGVEMIDIVHYKIPMGPLGKGLNRLFIAGQLQTIFSYRREKLDDVFNRVKG